VTRRIRPAGFCGAATDRAAGLRPHGRQLPDAASGQGTAESLAAQQSLIDRCGRLNPDAATGFEEYSAQFVKDTPEPEVVQLHASAANKSAYAKATAELATRPQPDETTLAAPGPEG
jgi:hypothetical protein